MPSNTPNQVCPVFDGTMHQAFFFCPGLRKLAFGSFPRWGKVGMGACGVITLANRCSAHAPIPAFPRKGKELRQLSCVSPITFTLIEHL